MLQSSEAFAEVWSGATFDAIVLDRRRWSWITRLSDCWISHDGTPSAVWLWHCRSPALRTYWEPATPPHRERVSSPLVGLGHLL